MNRMEQFWAERALRYGQARDLETKIRSFAAEEIARICKPGDRVVELGSGNGAVLQEIIKRTRDLTLEGVESSAEMARESQRRLPHVPIHQEPLQAFLDDAEPKTARAVLIINTLHNLENRQKMREAISGAAKMLEEGGVLIFDVRNARNPFISRGYRRNRAAGLQFFTLKETEVARSLAQAGCVLESLTPIYYDSLEDAGKQNKPWPYKFLYRFYLKLTRSKFLTPYYVVVARKVSAKEKTFVSIIWGYHRHFYGFAPVQNYQLGPLRVAKESGYKTIAYMINEQVDISKDPNFDPATEVVRYGGFLQLIRFLYKHRNDVVYANSVIWQNMFVVPYVCRKAVFMAHDSIRRRSWLKQQVENMALRFYWRVRLISTGEKDFLIKQGIKAEKLFVVPIAIDASHFKPTQEPRKDLVFLGNITPDNDVPTLVRALARVRKKHPDLKLHIIGDNRLETFRPFVAGLGLEKAVVERGYVTHEELARILPTFLMLANSVISSGQPLSIYESAAAGLALCLPNTMQLNTVLHDCALFHDLYDDEKLAQNIITYIENPSLAQQHNQKARQLIKDRYNDEVVSKQLRHLFFT